MSKKRGKDIGKLPKKFSQPRPGIKKIWIQSAAVFIVAAIVYYVMQGMSQRIHFLSAENTEQLKKVFFGNESWVVLCHNDSTPLPNIFQNAHRDLSKEDIRFGVLDCGQRLPSGKTTYSRMNLNPATKPTIFVTGPGAQPYQIRPESMKTATGLINRVRAVLDPKTVPITSTKALKERCLSKKLCALILKENEKVDEYLKAAVKKLKLQYRSSMTFASLDAAKYKLELNPMLERGYGDDRFLIFKQMDNGTKPGMIEYSDVYEAEKMATFIDGIISNSTEVKSLRRHPLIKEWGEGKKPAFKERPKPEEKSKASKPAGRGRDARKKGNAQPDSAPSEQSEEPQEKPADEPKYYTPEELERIKKERREREAAKREQLEKEMEDFISAVDEDEVEEIVDEEEEIEEISFD